MKDFSNKGHDAIQKLYNDPETLKLFKPLNSAEDVLSTFTLSSIINRIEEHTSNFKVGDEVVTHFNNKTYYIINERNDKNQMYDCLAKTNGKFEIVSCSKSILKGTGKHSDKLADLIKELF